MERTAMPAVAIESAESISSQTPSPTAERHTAYRLRPIMRQGTASSIPETWLRFPTVAEARLAARQMYHDDHVLRVFVVLDGQPPQFVEWIER
jgi:hypothetical protein